MNLESKFSAWRDRMRQAGIEPGPLLDELESHLRDSFAARVRAGQSEDEAFLEATEQLGIPHEIRRECDAALSTKDRWQRQLHGEIFPTNLNLCAWVAFALAPLFAIRGFAHLPGGAISNLVPPILCLAGLAGFLGACLWVGRKSPAAAGLLALFWTVALWYFLFDILIFILARLSPYLAGLIAMGASLGFFLTCPAAVFTFLMWSRRLRAASEKIRQPA